jgi:tetratricopeptide (TPR) repeat protein
MGLSQRDLGTAGLSTSYISLLESGRRRPTAKVVRALAQALGVDVEFLMNGQQATLRQTRELEVRFAELALLNGDSQHALEALERLRAGSTPEDPLRWDIDYNLARALERCGELEAAVALLEELHERAADDPARSPAIQVALDLSRCYREAGDLSRAVDVAERAVEHARRLGLSEPDLPRLIVTLAAASMERGDHLHASGTLHRLLASLGPAASRRDRASALWQAATVAGLRGHYAEGIKLAERAISYFAEEEDVRAEGLLRTTLAWMLLESPHGDPGKALQLLEDAHRRLRAAGMQIELAYTETELARVCVELGDADSALRWARSSLERLGDLDRLESGRARLALARALLANDEQAAAIHEMGAAAAALGGVAAGRQSAAAWRELADLLAKVGDDRGAQVAYSQALSTLGIRGRPAAAHGAPSPRPVEAPSLTPASERRDASRRSLLD